MTTAASDAFCTCTNGALGADIKCVQIIVPEVLHPAWTLVGACAYAKDVLVPEIKATFTMAFLPCGDPAQAGFKVDIENSEAAVWKSNYGCGWLGYYDQGVEVCGQGT